MLRWCHHYGRTLTRSSRRRTLPGGGAQQTARCWPHTEWRLAAVIRASCTWRVAAYAIAAGHMVTPADHGTRCKGRGHRDAEQRMFGGLVRG